MAITVQPDPIHVGDTVTATTDWDPFDLMYIEIDGVVLDRSLSSGVVSAVVPEGAVTVRVFVCRGTRTEIVRVRVS